MADELIGVVIADDQELVRAGFEMILDAQPDIHVVGVAGDGVECVELARRLKPHVVLVDIRMPRLDGLEVTRTLVGERNDAAGTNVVVITTFDQDDYVRDALRFGAVRLPAQGRAARAAGGSGTGGLARGRARLARGHRQTTVSRYRSERAAGYDAREAAARSNSTAGSAVVFAGLTVIIALAGLAVVSLPILTAMGTAAAGAVVVFGLAMDYQVFLVTRTRGAYIHGATPRDAITEGFRHSARVVTAAALFMTGVFRGFMTGHDAVIKSLGFGLAAAVVFDAFVVRMTIVPAVLALLGRRAWTLPG